jgi:uncharacterized protein YciI
VAIFAVTYNYSASADALAEVRPIHRDYLANLLTSGVLLASGPLVDRAGALLILQGESAEQIGSVLDLDPFDIAGFIGERAIEQWNPVFGPWSAA